MPRPRERGTHANRNHTRLDETTRQQEMATSAERINRLRALSMVPSWRIDIFDILDGENLLPARISQEKESAIISLYLQGVSEAETAEKEHVS